MSTKAWVSLTFALGLGGATLLSAGASGCGSDVSIEDDGAGGTGGQSSSNVTTSSSGTTSSTTSATTTSTSTGPGVGCEDACAYAAECGLDVCGFANIDCSAGNFDCPADCINGATCAEILGLLQGGSPALQACLQGCQGGSGAGGGSQQACGSCLQQNDCLPTGCQQNPTCQAWGACAINCNTPQCYADCNAANPNAAQFFEPLYACACTSCDGASACGGTMDPCNQGGGMGGMGAGGMGGGG
jgi:hypothetical protein